MAAKQNKKFSTERLTIESLEYYVPYFKLGLQAEQDILENNLTSIELNAAEANFRFKELVSNKISQLAGPLLTSELNKIISTSHIAYSDDLFNLLYYSGMVGLMKGLGHFDQGKMNKSATNYLLQWFVVYAKRELAAAESSHGIAPSRFQKYKKISAVRKHMEAELEREVTNEEVLEYFHSGRADIKNMNGKVGSSNKPSAANRNITLELVEEQQAFEKLYMHTDLLDPLADYSSDVKFAKKDSVPFSQTVFGVFSDRCGVKKEAIVVLLSELGKDQISDADASVAASMSPSLYKTYASAWKHLIKDPSGPFYAFLKSVESEDFDEFDIKSTIESIENSPTKTSSHKYNILFEEKSQK